MYGKNEELLERVFGKDKFTWEEMHALSLEKEKIYQANYWPSLKLIKGLDTFFEKAYKENIPMAIGTAAIPFNVDFVLDNLKLRKYFKAIVTADDVSKSGTLTYEAADQVAKVGLGISTAIGIGGDPIIGTTTKQAVELFMNDPETDAIVMIGEIGGGMEAEAAHYIKSTVNKKPVVGFIAGQTAPPGRRMGHAGAIVGGADDTAAAKMKIMGECGIHVVASPADIGKTMAEVIQ